MNSLVNGTDTSEPGPRGSGPAGLILLVCGWLVLAADLRAGLPGPATGVRSAETPSVADLAEQQKWDALLSRVKSSPDEVRPGHVGAVQADGMTALHWAVHHESSAAVEALLKSGADPNALTRYAVTPLSLACVNGHAGIVDLLLNAGADPNSALNGGETVLMTASRTGRSGPVRSLLNKGASINAEDSNRQTAVMWAAAEGHAEVVQVLIDSGAEFRKPLSSGFTPLCFAVREGRRDVVRVLLAAGADVRAVMEPERPGGRSVRKGTSPLILAIENGHFELAADLLQAGADPNDQRSGYTPLHVLTWVRKPNRGDGEDGDPPPIGSGTMSSLQFARVLTESGADVNARLERGVSGKGRLSQKGATPFLMAADTADVPYLKLLLELGADPSIPNVDHSTPLMAAAGLGTSAPGEEAGTEEECLEAVRYLQGLGADLNAVDDNGETAMHGAAYKNAPEVVRWLHQQGADIRIWNRHNKYGWTPLLIARGYRPGNFRPSATTLEALREVMQAAGVTPSMKDEPTVPLEDQYAPAKRLPSKPQK